jgi:hypothetical protein
MLSLVGVGALALGYGIYDAVQGDEPRAAAEEQRNGYSTREECERNYSKEQCTPGQTYRPGVGFIPIFWGPYYSGGSAFAGRSSLDPGPGRIGLGTVSETRPRASSERGGFGGGARAHAGSAGS